MRKIEFRGKRKDNGRWVYGAFFQYHGKAYIIDDNNIDLSPEKHCAWIYSVNGIIEVIPDSVGQYFGIAGKTSILLYEEDIIQFNNPDCIAIIKFGTYNNEEVSEDNQSGYGWYIANYNMGRFDDIEDAGMLDIYTLKLIGNKTDNPELLEVA